MDPKAKGEFLKKISINGIENTTCRTEGESQIVPNIKEGWLGRIFYTFDGKVLTLIPYQKRLGEVGFPTMADLTQPIIITIDWLRELLGTTEAKGAEETDTKEKGQQFGSDFGLC